MTASATQQAKKNAQRKQQLDLRFQQFGKWFVLGKASGKGNEGFWVCQCECNTQAEIQEDFLIDGRAKSCGCDYRDRLGRLQTFQDFTGQKLGEYLALSYLGYTSQAYWLCVCVACGTQKSVRWGVLLQNTGGCRHCTQRSKSKLQGKVFGDLVVLHSIGVQGNGAQLWQCLCGGCGTKKNVLGHELVNGTTKSCGCARRREVNARLEADYGFWHVLQFIPGVGASTGPAPRTHPSCLCRCRCGHEQVITVNNLRRGKSRSCRQCVLLRQAEEAATLDLFRSFIVPADAKTDAAEVE